MCGIFAYINYLTPKSRKEILDLLINGLKRLEYRGYDSAGKSSFFIWLNANVYIRGALSLEIYFFKFAFSISHNF